ncbi:hypothetical protein AYL99_09056 [Fonsecaea erecta]|uniref:Uncharacterized protein n=1 Tax=Fonsecaea erecta TaxID=1367422 RepID=A0A178ZAY6_9EURO|nr:hypothetical protein AYL99_09056 [Fonsecaea erecta]OAP56944.1 hypothetical protein AYL99_09056 [Fonsecaea erecta]
MDAYSRFGSICSRRSCSFHAFPRINDTQLSSNVVGDEFVLGFAFFVPVLCFGFSTPFHLLRSHSYHVQHFWGKVDVLSICILAIGSATSATYVAVYCNETMRHVYWAINVVAGTAAGVTFFDTGGGGQQEASSMG